MRRLHLQRTLVVGTIVSFAAVVMLLLLSRGEVARVAPSSADSAPEARRAVAEVAAPFTAGAPVPSTTAVSAHSLAPCAANEPASEVSAGDAARRGLAQARERLLASREAEHLAAAALLARNNRDRVADVTRAMAVGQDNATVAWLALRICDGAGAGVTCPATQWEDELRRLDGQNTEVWINVAIRRLARGERKEALEAMQRAGAAAETRDGPVLALPRGAARERRVGGQRPHARGIAPGVRAGRRRTSCRRFGP
jgi:hypothetical protein